jgi:hypothetical protein
MTSFSFGSPSTPLDREESNYSFAVPSAPPPQESYDLRVPPSYAFDQPVRPSPTNPTQGAPVDWHVESLAKQLVDNLKDKNYSTVFVVANMIKTMKTQRNLPQELVDTASKSLEFIKRKGYTKENIEKAMKESSDIGRRYAPSEVRNRRDIRVLSALVDSIAPDERDEEREELVQRLGLKGVGQEIRRQKEIPIVEKMYNIVNDRDKDTRIKNMETQLREELDKKENGNPGGVFAVSNGLFYKLYKHFNGSVTKISEWFGNMDWMNRWYLIIAIKVIVQVVCLFYTGAAIMGDVKASQTYKDMAIQFGVTAFDHVFNASTSLLENLLKPAVMWVFCTNVFFVAAAGFLLQGAVVSTLFSAVNFTVQNVIPFTSRMFERFKTIFKVADFAYLIQQITNLYSFTGEPNADGSVNNICKIRDVISENVFPITGGIMAIILNVICSVFAPIEWMGFKSFVDCTTLSQNVSSYARRLSVYTNGLFNLEDALAQASRLYAAQKGL